MRSVFGRKCFKQKQEQGKGPCTNRAGARGDAELTERCQQALAEEQHPDVVLSLRLLPLLVFRAVVFLCWSLRAFGPSCNSCGISPAIALLLAPLVGIKH